jgi:hypothetical protein
MPRSGLSALKRGIAFYFDSIGESAEVHVGLRARNRWEVPRVILIPGHFGGSNAPAPMAGGTFGEPTQKASVNPRELSSWNRELTFSIYAREVKDLTNAEVQNDALEDLVEHTRQACFRAVDPESEVYAGGAGLVWGESQYQHPPVEDSAGQELLIWARMLTPLYDQAQLVAFPGFTIGRNVVTGNGGSSASITAATGGLVTVSGFGGMTSSSWTGQYLALSGASIAANNGSFPIAGLVSPNAVLITNALGVAPDPANGSITWRLSPSGA